MTHACTHGKSDFHHAQVTEMGGNLTTYSSFKCRKAAGGGGGGGEEGDTVYRAGDQD